MHNNLWKFTPTRAWWKCSLIEQSWCEGLKCPTRARLGYARATGEWLAATGADNPCRRCKLTAGICHQFLWPESCPVSSHTNQELCGEARLETALSRVRPAGSFDPRADAVTPEGIGCYCADQNAVAVSGGTTPPKGPVRSGRGAQGNHGRAERTDLAKSAKSPHWGGPVKRGHPSAKAKGNLRGKRSDP